MQDNAAHKSNLACRQPLRAARSSLNDVEPVSVSAGCPRENVSEKMRDMLCRPLSRATSTRSGRNDNQRPDYLEGAGACANMAKRV
ncbi:hypothetical protein RRG08_035336 [Elysia crispata]|uniref:Uncharacterized protein n=1 Tax=Elysia crispata TaxID=231223 RepID=A0AAE0Y3V4_9GAST|nr:hypothetical protein RRG08_035336 [Elysia crispata]